MEIGTVTGSVWATRKARELGGHTLLVLLVCGSTARLYCPESPVDTAIVAILDQMEVDHVST